jgi:hypothetical protein
MHFAYGIFTLFDRPSQWRSAIHEVFDFAPTRESQPGKSYNTHCTTVHAYHVQWVWALPRSLAATWGISV